MAAQLLRRWRYWWLQLLWGGLVLLGVWGAVAGAHTLYVPYVAADKKQWTELALYNPGEVEVGLFATAFDAKGRRLGRGLPVLLRAARDVAGASSGPWGPYPLGRSRRVGQLVAELEP